MHQKPEGGRLFKKYLGASFLQGHVSCEYQRAFEDTIKKVSKLEVEELPPPPNSFVELEKQDDGPSILNLKRFKGSKGAQKKACLQALNLNLIREAIKTLNTIYQFNGKYYDYYIDFDLPPDPLFANMDVYKKCGTLHFKLNYSQATLSLDSNVRILSEPNKQNYFYVMDRNDSMSGEDLLRSCGHLFDFSLPRLFGLKCTGVIDFEQPEQSYLELVVEPKHTGFKYNDFLGHGYWSEVTELQPARTATSLGIEETDQASKYSESSRSCCCLLFDIFRGRRHSSRVSVRQGYGTMNGKHTVPIDIAAGRLGLPVIHSGYQESLEASLNALDFSSTNTAASTNRKSRPPI